MLPFDRRGLCGVCSRRAIFGSFAIDCLGIGRRGGAIASPGPSLRTSWSRTVFAGWIAAAQPGVVTLTHRLFAGGARRNVASA